VEKNGNHIFAPLNFTTMMNFTALQSTLETLDLHFKTEAGKSVNRFLTMRNWLFGFYIVEFQQNGADRAAYGEQLLRELSKRLDSPGFSFRNLNLYRQFYLTYPQLANPIAQYLETNPIWQPLAAKLPEKQAASIGQTLSAKFQSPDNQSVEIVQPLAAQLSPPPENYFQAFHSLILPLFWPAPLPSNVLSTKSKASKVAGQKGNSSGKSNPCFSSVLG
jgi:hypothetical protein